MLFIQRAKRFVRQWKLEKRCVAGSGTILTGSVTNRQGRREAIRIGTRSRIAAELLVYDDAGLIEIGDDCVINGGARIWSADAVRIGDRVLISHDVFIHDCNAHPLSARRRFQHVSEIREGRLYRYDDIAHAPIVIEDDVWINAAAMILKGVTIGRGAVVGAGALVTRDVEPYTIVAGVPAGKIGDAWE
ncbi:MAG TPA: acyltransferase [Methylococcus sp.]|nr:acyltransferase [Methylococcus sp.]